MPVSPNGHVLNLVRSGPDIRDWLFAAPHAVAVALPPSVDLRSGMGPIVDQGQLGSCVGQATAAIDEFDLIGMGIKDYRPSRLLAYLNARELEGTIGYDAGASIRDGVVGLAKRGLCKEELWPYDISKFREIPANNIYTEAGKNKATAYRAVIQNADQVRGALAAGRPVIYGFAVYNSFEFVDSTGLIGPPSGGLYGYHANVLCGYDDASQRFLTRNSWSTGWGDHGYGRFRYVDILNPNFAFDFWVVDTVTAPVPIPPPPVPPVPPTPVKAAKQVNVEVVYTDGTKKTFGAGV